MEVDRFVDLRRRRARTNDELGRQAVAHDHAMAAHAFRPPHLQLDLLAADVHEGNVLHARMIRAAIGRSPTRTRE